MSQDLIIKMMRDGRLRLSALLLLLAALAYQISLVFWHFYPTPSLTGGGQTTSVAQPARANRTQVNFQQQAKAISQAFLFGKAQVKAVVVQQVEEAPETKLNYKLRGIYYSTVPRLSSAIIEVQANKSKHYLLEDELASNITLARIEQDHVLISRYGKLERLNLQKPKPPTGAQLAQARAGNASGDSSAILRTYKQRYTSNPLALATRFQAIPVQQDGKNIGFKLKALRGETLLKKLNFEPNDVFTSINGVSLNNPFEALDALKSLTTASSVSVTFLRNGAEQTADFRL